MSIHIHCSLAQRMVVFFEFGKVNSYGNSYNRKCYCMSKDLFILLRFQSLNIQSVYTKPSVFMEGFCFTLSTSGLLLKNIAVWKILYYTSYIQCQWKTYVCVPFM